MWYIRECAIDRKASFAEIGSHRNLQSLISSFLKESCLCNKRTWHLWTMYCARCLPSVKWRYALGCVPAVVSKVDDSDNVWRRYAVQCLVLATQAFFFLYSFLHMCLFIFRRPVVHCPVDAVTGARGVKDSGNCSVLQQRLELDRRRGGRGRGWRGEMLLWRIIRASLCFCCCVKVSPCRALLFSFGL